MEYIQNTLLNLLQQTAFLNLSVGNLIMTVLAGEPGPAVSKRLSPPSPCTDFLWYAACKYLPGYYAEH